MQCRSEGEVAGYRHLLAFIHSMGKEVPQGEFACFFIFVLACILQSYVMLSNPSLAAVANDLIQLLLLAREHAVEPAVLACLQKLQEQASLHNSLWLYLPSSSNLPVCFVSAGLQPACHSLPGFAASPGNASLWSRQSSGSSKQSGGRCIQATLQAFGSRRSCAGCCIKADAGAISGAAARDVKQH